MNPIINEKGDKYWYHNGRCHRTTGPAIEYANGNKEYWVNDRQLTQDEWIVYQFVNNKTQVSV